MFGKLVFGIFRPADLEFQKRDQHVEKPPLADYSSKKEHALSRRDILYQGFVSLVAYSLVIHAGINLALSTILHPQLDITKEQASWIASLGAIGTPVGSLSVGFLMDRIGRQKTLIVASAVTVIAWSILCLIPSEFDIRLIYLARFFQGFGSGMTSISIVYVAEVTDKNWRPFFLSFNSIAVSVGILITTTVGVVLTWRVFAVFGLSIITISTLICLTLPESPSWLIQCHPELAKKALSHFITNPKLLKAEWQVLERKQHKIAAKNQVFPRSIKEIKRPLSVVLVLITLQQLVGIYPTIFYSLELFQKITKGASTQERNTTFQKIDNVAGNWTEITQLTSFGNSTNSTNNEPSASTPLPIMDHTQGNLDLKSSAVVALMGLGVIRFIVSVCMTALSKRFGVKTLLTCSSLGVGITAAMFALHQTGWCSESSDTVSFGIILAFVTFGSLGLLVIPWTIIGELLPFEFRGIGQGVAVAYAYVLMFFVVKFYPALEDELGTSTVFASFSVVAFVTIAFVHFFVPETLGRTMDEIQSFFQRK